LANTERCDRPVLVISPRLLSAASVCFEQSQRWRKITMARQTYPRSPKALLGGIAHLGRFIDKIRLRNEGRIQDYNYITVGFDKHLVEFLEIDPKTFEQRALAGGTDEDLLAWAVANGKKVTAAEIRLFTRNLLGSKPEDDGA